MGGGCSVQGEAGQRHGKPAGLRVQTPEHHQLYSNNLWCEHKLPLHHLCRLLGHPLTNGVVACESKGKQCHF
jgi:hypothetical protein